MRYTNQLLQARKMLSDAQDILASINGAVNGDEAKRGNVLLLGHVCQCTSTETENRLLETMDDAFAGLWRVCRELQTQAELKDAIDAADELCQ